MSFPRGSANHRVRPNSREEFAMKAVVSKFSFVCISLTVMSLMCTGISNAGVRPENIVGLWAFDEGNGKTATDSSGNKNHGKLMGDTKWVKGKFGTALQFDGELDYVEVAHDDTLDITKELTIVAWAKFDKIPARENVLLDKGPKAGNAKYYLGYEPKEEAYFLNFNGQRWHAGDDFNSPKIKDTDWHHVAVAFDTASGKITSCVDSVCNEHKTDDALVSKGKDNLIIGDARFLETNRNFSYTGTIDEIAVYNVALTVNEIKLSARGSIADVAPAGKLATIWAVIKAK